MTDEMMALRTMLEKGATSVMRVLGAGAFE
jgi:hypothetical protein